MVKAVAVLVLSILLLAAHCYGTGSSLLSKITKDSGQLNLNMYRPDYTDISNFPFTVSVLAGLSLQGGGTLVKQNWVLTTASAVHGINTTNLRVRVGSNSAYTNGTLHKVTRVVEHPQFTSNTSYNIALLQLDTPVYLKVAKSISFLAVSPFVYDGVPGNVTGFGFDSSGSFNQRPYLQTKELAIHNSAWCRSYFRQGYQDMSDLIICTKSYNYQYFNLCYGDSGDPLTRCVSPTQCQLVAIYTPIPFVCNSKSVYVSLYVDIGHFYTWITETIGG